MYNITRGRTQHAKKVVIYGPAGIGKTLFAAKFPDPVFIDTEGSTRAYSLARFDPDPSSWAMLLDQVNAVRTRQVLCKTLVIDTADWAERIASDSLLIEKNWSSIEQLDYGKGWNMLSEKFGKLLDATQEVVDSGINVVFTAHSKTSHVDIPDETGKFDKWELNLSNKSAALLKQWADILIFANYRIYLIEDKSNSKKKKASGGRKVMYTESSPCRDAKNRYGLPEEADFDYSVIAHLFPDTNNTTQEPTPVIVEAPVQRTEDKPIEKQVTEIEEKPRVKPLDEFESFVTGNMDYYEPEQLKKLHELMAANDVTEDEIQQAVASRGYFPVETPLINYPEDFVENVLLEAWNAVYEMILTNRNNK